MRYEAMLFDYSFDIGIRFFYTSVGIVLCCTSHTNKWSVHWLAFIRWYTNMVSNRIAQLHSLLRFVQSFFLFISIRSFFHSSFFFVFHFVFVSILVMCKRSEKLINRNEPDRDGNKSAFQIQKMCATVRIAHRQSTNRIIFCVFFRRFLFSRWNVKLWLIS